MFNIRYMKMEDKEFWYSLDKHLPEVEYVRKFSNKEGYIIFDDEKPIGIMRYNLFWDTIPFLTMIYFEEEYREKGFGRKAMEYWENEMIKQEFKMIMTSTQADECAQHFYRKLGYKDIGCLVLDNIPGFEQPLEMFMAKSISTIG